MGRVSIKPWQHQIEAIEKAKARNYFAFFFEMGTGKTGAAARTLEAISNQQGYLPSCLILCPLIVIKNWRDEIELQTELPLSKVLLLYRGSGDKKCELLKEHLSKDRHSIVIVNYESLLHENLYAELFKWRPRVLIFDESHKLKSIKAKRTKRCIALADASERRYLLTGTPVLNSPMDLFSQYRIMDGGQTFGKNFYAFRNQYFYDCNASRANFRHFPKWVAKEKTKEKIQSVLSDSGMVVKKKDCLDLPPLIQKTIAVELSGEQRRAYREMEKNLITYINDKACVASVAITKLLRLQQIVSGFVKNEAGENIVFKENPRLEAMRDILENLGDQKICIWAVFRENYAMLRNLCEEMRLKYVEVHGDITADQKFASVSAFNGDPNVSVFIGHPGAGGIGINLTQASYMAFYSRGFSSEHDIQAESRNYRGGSEIHDKITRFDLVATNTIDERISKALLDKEQLGEELILKMMREVSLCEQKKEA